MNSARALEVLLELITGVPDTRSVGITVSTVRSENGRLLLNVGLLMGGIKSKAARLKMEVYHSLSSR